MGTTDSHIDSAVSKDDKTQENSNQNSKVESRPISSRQDNAPFSSSSVSITTKEKSFKLQKLSQDMAKLFIDESRCDVRFKCESDILKAHKIILCARSPVFEAMFHSSFQESLTGVVDIKDVSSEAFRCLLKYLYSGVVPDLSVPLAGEILNAAEKYQVLELKSACIDFLHFSITNANVLLILELAFLHDENLKNFAMNHISKNIRDIKKLPIWLHFEITNPSLMFEVMNFVINDIAA